jgi:hypothetical protein
MSGKAVYSASSNDSSYILESKKMDLEAGWIGKCFGSRINAPLNIAGVFVMLLAVSGVAVLFTSCSIPASEYWKTIAPLMTMAMGYIFGKSSKD